jgi:hypothetical protein
MKQLQNVFDSAVRGGRATEHGFMFKGNRLNAEAKSDGNIRVWFADDSDEENVFETRRKSSDEFVEHVEEWVSDVTAADEAEA